MVHSIPPISVRHSYAWIHGTWACKRDLLIFFLHPYVCGMVWTRDQYNERTVKAKVQEFHRTLGVHEQIHTLELKGDPCNLNLLWQGRDVRKRFTNSAAHCGESQTYCQKLEDCDPINLFTESQGWASMFVCWYLLLTYFIDYLVPVSMLFQVLWAPSGKPGTNCQCPNEACLHSGAAGVAVVDFGPICRREKRQSLFLWDHCIFKAVPRN